MDDYVLSYDEIMHPVQEYQKYLNNSGLKIPEIDTKLGFKTGTIVDIKNSTDTFTGIVTEKDDENYHVKCTNKLIKIPLNQITSNIQAFLETTGRNKPTFEKFLKEKSIEIPKDDEYMLHASGYILKFQPKTEILEAAKSSEKNRKRKHSEERQIVPVTNEVRLPENVVNHGTLIFQTWAGNRIQNSQVNANTNVEDRKTDGNCNIL